LAKRKSLGKTPTRLMNNYLATMASHITIEDLAPAGADSVAEVIRRQGVRSTLERGEAVVLPSGEAVLFVESGRLDVFLPAGADRTLIASLTSGSIFGVMPLLGHRTLGADLVAAEDCVVVMLDQGVIAEVIRRSPATAIRLMKKIGQLLNEAEELVLAQGGWVRPGLIGLLLRLADGRGLVTGVGQQDLADLLGVSRTTIWRCLEQLRREELVDWTRMKIALRDQERMRRVQWVPDAIVGPDTGE
jgi:CRP-like cAMP-binding protein